jgi:alcohol oxidase
LVWAYKKFREIPRQMECFAGEVPGAHPSFGQDSGAACYTIDCGTDVKDAMYTAEDDKVIEQWVRRIVMTIYHSLYSLLKRSLQGNCGYEA